MKLVFVHGWGFDAKIWDGIASHFKDMEVSRIDLGFLGEPSGGEVSGDSAQISGDAVVIGHSLGAMWALKNMTEPPRGFISICGFDRFSPPVERKLLTMMKRGMAQKPDVQLNHFWRNCGIAPYSAPQNINPQALAKGLDWLMNWDARMEFAQLQCPCHTMAAKDDQVLPFALSCKIWGEDYVQWSEEGGHALPLTRPKWCADHVRGFLEENF